MIQDAIQSLLKRSRGVAARLAADPETAALLQGLLPDAAPAAAPTGRTALLTALTAAQTPAGAGTAVRNVQTGQSGRAQAAGIAQTGAWSASGLWPGPAEAAGAAGADPEALSLAFERDARRYDGADAP